MRRPRRGSALLELMVYVGALAIFTTAIGSAFTGSVRSHRMLKSRAAAADRLERVMRAFREDAAASTAVSTVIAGSARMQHARGFGAWWRMDGDRLVRSMGVARGRNHQIMATQVQSFAVKEAGDGAVYLAVTLKLPLERGVVSADTLVRVGPPWRLR